MRTSSNSVISYVSSSTSTTANQQFGGTGGGAYGQNNNSNEQQQAQDHHQAKPLTPSILEPGDLQAQLIEEKRLRSRAKYLERAQERKIELYMKAQDCAREREGQNCRMTEVTFRINFSSNYGQQLCIVGSLQELGSWDTSKAEPLTWTEGNNWLQTIRLPNIDGIQYKYIVKSDNEVHWEWGKNHVINLSKSDSKKVVFDSWGGGPS